jgi:hypothetical protein
MSVKKQGFKQQHPNQRGLRPQKNPSDPMNPEQSISGGGGLGNAICEEEKSTANFVSKAQYVEMYQKMAKTLRGSDLNEADAFSLAEQDFVRDHKKAGVPNDFLCYSDFHDGLFEMADLWTVAVEAQHYVDFLQRLYDRITVKRETTNEVAWRPLEEIKPLTPRKPEKPIETVEINPRRPTPPVDLIEETIPTKKLETPELTEKKEEIVEDHPVVSIPEGVEVQEESKPQADKKKIDEKKHMVSRSTKQSGSGPTKNERRFVRKRRQKKVDVPKKAIRV